MSDTSKLFDQLALDVANNKLTLAGAFRVAYLKGFERRLPSAGEAYDDDMCPNCVTPWKCNGPHCPALE